MFKSLSTSLIARGILAVIIGIIALAWPSVTVLALVIVFAVYAFIAAGAGRAGVRQRRARPVIGHLLLGLVDRHRRSDRAGLAGAHRAGPGADRGHVGDHRRPGRVPAAFASLRRACRTRAMLILGGLTTIAFGVVLCARPGIGESPSPCCSACST